MNMFKTPKHAIQKQNNQEQRGNKEIKEENVNVLEEDVCSKLKIIKKKKIESYTIGQELNMKNMCALFKQYSSYMLVLFIHP